MNYTKHTDEELAADFDRLADERDLLEGLMKSIRMEQARRRDAEIADLKAELAGAASQ